MTLTVWDQEVLGGQNEQMQKLNADFHDKYPNVTIKRAPGSFSDLQKTLLAWRCRAATRRTSSRPTRGTASWRRSCRPAR